MLSPYDLLERDKYTYEFVTQQGVRYAIYFLDYSYMFDKYPNIADNIYTFNIDVVNGVADNSIANERIGLTVLEVFRLFFSKMQNVAVYVCDNLDDRHIARKRKFDLWFWKYNDGTLIKEDGIAIIEDLVIYNFLLIHKSNTHLMEIILAYKELNEKAGEK